MKSYKFVVILFIAVLLTACSSKDSSTMPMTNSMTYDSDYANFDTSAAADSGEYLVYEERVYEESENSRGESEDFAPPAETTQQKIIKNASISMNVNDYDAVFNQIKAMTETVGGYVESADSYVYSGERERNYKNGSVTLRVPSVEFDNIRNSIKSLGEVISDNESAENVTQQYYDIDSRLKAKLTEEQRLIEMIEIAESVSDLILLEERLSYVRAEADSLSSKLKNIDQLSSFSTINLHLSEQRENIIAPVSRNLPQRISDAFIGSVNGIIRFFEALLVFLAGASMQLLVLGILGTIGFIIFKKQKNKRDINNKEDIDNHEKK